MSSGPRSLPPQFNFSINVQLVAHPSLRTPIDRLPYELLAQIFELGQNSNITHISSAAPQILHYALGLASVSTHWRDVARATPALWLHIYATAPSPRLEKTVSRLKMQLERSSSASLNLTVNFLALKRAEDVRVIWQLVAPHLSRCRRLDITGVRKVTTGVIFPFKNLERLTDVSIHTQSLLDLGSVFGPHSALRLNSMRLINLNFTSLPVQSLRSLSIAARPDDPQNLRDVLDVLRSWPGVTELQSLELDKVDFPRARNDEAALPDPLSLPNLVSLRIHDGPLGNYLSLPRLKVLTCDWLGVSGRVPELPTVEHLTIVESLGFVGSALAPFPGVRTLVLSGETNARRWFDVLNRTTTAGTDESNVCLTVPSYVPELELLQVRGRAFFDGATRAFELLESVMKLRPRLRAEFSEIHLGRLSKVEELSKDVLDRVSELAT